MDNVVILTSSDSDSDFSDDSDGHSDREEVIYDSEHFMNHVNKKEYEINRNKLFTKDIEQLEFCPLPHPLVYFFQIHVRLIPLIF